VSEKAIMFWSWRKTLRGHLALARISNSPTVVSNTLAGAALGGIIWPDVRVGLVAIAMVLFYSAGMYLNDLLDYTIDCAERPERPLPAGMISRTSARAMIIALFASGSVLLWSVSSALFLCGLILIALIICYNRWHKKNPAGPLLMALCRLMVYVIAFLSASSQTFFPLLVPGELLLCYVIALTLLAKVELKPRAIHFGSSLMLFLPAIYFMLQLSALALGLSLCFTSWVAYSLSLIYRSSPSQMGRAVSQLIAGIALLDGMVLATVGSIYGVVVALASFGLALFWQRYVRGT